MLLGIECGILFVDTVDTKIKAHNALNAMFVRICRHCRYEVSLYMSTLSIQTRYPTQYTITLL